MQVRELAAETAAPALARLYNPPAYADAWECVEDYLRVIEYQAEHPDHGRTRVGRALDLPPGRVRGWLKDTVPDPVRAVQIAEDLGWIDARYQDEAFRGLNGLVAWVFSGGSIRTENYVPLFAVDSSTARNLLSSFAESAGTPITLSRKGDDERAREYRPDEHASVLGRALYLLGAPVGSKNPEANLRLPSYLDDAPAQTRWEFVRAYVLNRGAENPESRVTILREERSKQYLYSLADFIEDVAGAPVSVSDWNVILSTRAVESIESGP